METAQEHPCVQPGAAIDDAEGDALFDIVLAVLAADHGDQVIALQAQSLGAHFASREQAAGLGQGVQIAEEGLDVLIKMFEHILLQFRDVF